MKIVLALITTLLLAGCASDKDYSSEQEARTIQFTRPAGDPGAPAKLSQ